MIKNNITKNIAFNNNITLQQENGEIISVVGQSASINENLDVNISTWKNNEDLYKSNRTSIRSLQAEFEDFVYSEQDKLIAEANTDDDTETTVEGE